MFATQLGAVLLPTAKITMSGHMGLGETIMFVVLAITSVGGALNLLFAKRAVYAAVSMVLVMVSLAIMYVVQDAPFLGMVQIVVYTGAIMMLFVFVLMLVGVDIADSFLETLRGQRWIAAVFGLGFLAILIAVAVKTAFPKAVGMTEANTPTNPGAEAQNIFGNFPLTVVAVGLLLIISAIGAVVLTHQVKLHPSIKQRDRADERVRKNVRVGPFPVPGVYAKRNAVDVPALDPTGEPIDVSIPHSLRIRGQVRRSGAYEMRPIEDSLRPLPRLDASRIETVDSPHSEGKEEEK